MNVGEKHGNTLSSLMRDLGPKNPSMFADGDPFLVKLQEIDRGLRKFDNLLSDKSGNSKLRGVEVEVFTSPLDQANLSDGLGPEFLKEGSTIQISPTLRPHFRIFQTLLGQSQN